MLNAMGNSCNPVSKEVVFGQNYLWVWTLRPALTLREPSEYETAKSR